MTDYTDIEARLDGYSEAFDFYMECGDMPPEVEADDCLAGYIKETIDNNPQIDGSDPTWVEVLKENLLSYINVLLKAFAQWQREMEEELRMIASFSSASLERKRKMWPEVCRRVRQGYTAAEVNIDGYSRQFADHDADAVFAALTGDWETACRDRFDRQCHALLQRSQRQWENDLIEIGSVDYEERRRIKDIVYRSPVLKEIVEIIGRSKDSTAEEDNIIYSFLPKGLATAQPSEEIDRVETGADLPRVLPAEYAMPDDLFFKRYATAELQQLGSTPRRSPKKTELHRPKPRPKKGPIIVAIDTSGSMYGRPEQMAKSLLVQLVTIARRERRSCYLITFSVRIRTIDLGRSANLLKMKEFLDKRFTGGNGEEELIVEALRLLESGDYEMADVLIISDFIFYPPKPADIKRVAGAKSKGTRFYGLQINSDSTVYDPILDKKWKA